MTASRYEVLARIATGGMASVFVGRLKTPFGVSRLVALKRPHPFILADPSLRQSVIEEARAASAIHHANVVAVVDVELVDEEPILVLEYVEGATLSELLVYAAEKQTYFPSVAMRIVLDAARGLHAAHTQTDAGGRPLGILHRDVSPHNVLVGVDGVARLSDFGIAKITSERRERTTTGVLKGKLGYLAPEYVNLKQFDMRSDLFAYAVVAWEALTGRRLFGGGSEVETLSRVLSLARPSIASFAPELVPLEGVLSRALSRNPDERHRSVAELADELEAVADASIGIASAAEVTALVELVAGEELRARRESLERATARPAERMDDIPLRPASARDVVATRSFEMREEVKEAQPTTAGEPLPEPDERGRPSQRRRLVFGGAVVLVLAFVLLVSGTLIRSQTTPLVTSPSSSASEEAVVLESPPPIDSADPAGQPIIEPSGSATRVGKRIRPPPSRTNNKGRNVGSATQPPGFPSHAPPNPYAP